MIVAHVAGLPFEEAIPQLAPVVVGAVTALGVFRERARSWRGFGSFALAALMLALIALAWSAAALADPGGRSAATITGSFSDGCRDFTASSTKDISHVELQHADGRVVKDETIDSPGYAIDGAAGDELDAAVVKSGTTTETFTCQATNAPPTATLEIETPPLTDCFYNTSEYPSCLATDPRTVWSRPPEGVLAFVFVSPVPQEISFRGTSSTDPDDDIASWSIDFGDGTSTSGGWTTEPPAEVTHSYQLTYLSPVLAEVTLTVTDESGQTDSDTIILINIDGSLD